MLDIVETYEYSSAASYEAIEVLDIMKTAFDDEDIETLKQFVKVNLASMKKTFFTFPGTGRKTTKSNLATIVKIGIALKRLTTTGTTATATTPPQQQFGQKGKGPQNLDEINLDSIDIDMDEDDENENEMEKATVSKGGDQTKSTAGS